MNIALFGGAFDPPHIGHKQVADNLIEKNIVDEVWFVPVYEHPWAKKFGKEFLTPYKKRVEMLELMLGDTYAEREVVLKDKQKIAHFRGVSFTYDTLEFFSQKHSEHTFSWVMGSEYLSKFDKFLEGHPKLMDYRFYIYPREGGVFEPMYENMMALKDMPEIMVSSSMVRERVKKGEDISELVVEKVNEMLVKEKLYSHNF